MLRTDMADPSLIWTSPESLLVVEDWATKPVVQRKDDTSSMTLNPNQTLFVPLDGGEWMRVECIADCAELQLGAALGAEAVPNTVVWNDRGVTRFQLPAWSQAKYAAVRTSRAVTLTVSVSARANAALEWFLADAQMAAWLRKGTSPPELTLGSEARRIRDAIASLRQTTATARRGEDSTLLLDLWLKESLRVRPLSRPFFLRTTTATEPASTLHGPVRKAFQHRGADVHRWTFRAWGAARVVIREKGLILRVLDWSPAKTERAAWSDAQLVRTATQSSEGGAEIEVVHGTVSVGVDAYALRPRYRELFGTPLRTHEAVSDAAQLGSEPAHRDDSQVPRLQDDAAASPRASARFPLTPYLHYVGSLRASNLDEAVARARLGLANTNHEAWQALFTQRLLDLGAMQAVFTSAQRGRRPALGDQLDASLQATPYDALLGRLTRDYWKAFPFRNVPPPLGAPTRTILVPIGEQGRCTPTPEKQEFWLVPDPGITDFSVDLEPNQYAIATLRPIDEVPSREGYVEIDGVPVVVHAGAGLSSRVALSRGFHRLRRAPGSPRFALEVTWGMTLPCDRLYRWQRYAKLSASQKLRFELPSPGAPSLARLRFDEPIAAHIWLTTAQRQFELQTRPTASGSVEFLVAADEDWIELRTDRDIALSLALRREHDVRPSSEALPLVAARSVGVSSLAPRKLDPRKLTELAELGRRLRGAPTKEVERATRESRGRLLHELGFSVLALRDIAALPGPEDVRSDVVRIDGSSASVIPIGHISNIPPVILPQSIQGLQARRAAWQQTGPETCALDLESLPESGADAETLLAAHCAERSGMSHAAALLFARVARSARHGPTMLHAATLMADAAVNSRDQRLGLEAALLGARAASWGADPDPLRARLGNAIEWLSVPHLDGASGATWLSQGLAREPSSRQLLLRALVDAPPRALVIDDDEAAEILVDASGTDALELSWGCDAGQLDPDCNPLVWLDNAAVSCAARPRGNACVLSLPRGKHRLRFSLGGAGSIGWLEATRAEVPLQPTIASSWSVIEPETPARLVVKGPTVLRIQSRGSGAAGEALVLSGCGIDEAFASLRLPAGRDYEQRAWPMAVPGSHVGARLEALVPIEESGRCNLQISARQPHTLLRISLARAIGIPKARTVTRAEIGSPLPTEYPASESVVSTKRVLAIPEDHSTAMPLLVGARTRFVSESIARALEHDAANSGDAFGDLFGEVAALAARELVSNRLFGSVQTGLRLRNGPPTEFARWSFDLPPKVDLPGVQLLGSVHSQALDRRRTSTYSTTAKLSKRWAIAPIANLTTFVGYTSILVGQAPATSSGVDGEVYSDFIATHPRHASLATTVALRPFVDVLVNFTASARSLPELDGLDRLSATAELLTIPVAEWPWMVGIDWMSSYRPVSALRSEAFVRHHLGLDFGWWRWMTLSERLRIFGRVDLFFDAPAARLDALFVAPSLGVEITTSGSRGLRDLSPQQAPFKEFQERHSGRVRTGRSGELEEPVAEGAAP